MTNFVLVDAPNFVILASTTAAAERPSLAPPEHLNPLFNEVLRLLGVGLAADDPASPVNFNDASAPKIKRVLARYGFDLPPLTVGELLGLFEYCDRLDAITGKDIFPSDQQARWQQLSFALGGGNRGPCQRVLEMYANGDLRGLRAFHRAHDTLTRIGRMFRPPEG